MHSTVCCMVFTPKPEFLRVKRESGIACRILAQIAITSGSNFCQVVEGPKVMYPFSRAGSPDTSGASRGGL